MRDCGNCAYRNNRDTDYPCYDCVSNHMSGGGATDYWCESKPEWIDVDKLPSKEHTYRLTVVMNSRCLDDACCDLESYGDVIKREMKGE